jgi:hypothetical protein
MYDGMEDRCDGIEGAKAIVRKRGACDVIKTRIKKKCPPWQKKQKREKENGKGENK